MNISCGDNVLRVHLKRNRTCITLSSAVFDKWPRFGCSCKPSIYEGVEQTTKVFCWLSSEMNRVCGSTTYRRTLSFCADGFQHEAHPDHLSHPDDRSTCLQFLWNVRHRWGCLAGRQTFDRLSPDTGLSRKWSHSWACCCSWRTHKEKTAAGNRHAFRETARSRLDLGCGV